jgi:hypothetical protein
MITVKQEGKNGTELFARDGRARSQRHYGYVWELLAELAQSTVVGTEVVTPLGDAVCLVDHKSPELVTHVHLSEDSHKVGCEQLLGRN